MLGWRPRDLDLGYVPFLRGRGIAQYTSDPVFRAELTRPAPPPAQSTAIRTHASVGQKLWTLGVSYELVDVDAEEDPRQYAFLSATYQVYETLRLAATAGAVRDRVVASSPLSRLSPKQRATLEAAWREGWYDRPRRVDQARLARRLKVSRPALAERLQRAEANVMRALFEG